jgi:protein arginine N-methyltransferase 1
MPLNPHNRIGVARLSALGRLTARFRAWAQSRPGWLRWAIPGSGSSPELRYREFNSWYFGRIGEQEKMLADRRRMDFYHAAITRHIHPGDRVVDLGTGTGILAAFAARRGAAKVYAIDHSKILKHARSLAAHNGIENVEFIAAHSKDFAVDEPVDVIVHDQMGDCLFDESMVSNVADLRDRILKPGGLILPGRFEFYCEPLKLKEERQVPFLWEMNVHGFDFSCLERSRPQEPDYYRLRAGDFGMVEHFLGVPEPALEIDLGTLAESDMPRTLRIARTVVNAGRLDGFAVYFRARVDDDLCLSSDPMDPDRAPHWGFRILRTDRDYFDAGEVVELNLAVERWPDLDSWRWSLAKHVAPGDPAMARHPPRAS